MSDANQQDAKETPGSGIPPMDRVRHEMERWLDVARTTGERALETLGLASSGRPNSPAIDVVELDAEIVVLVDLPGVSAEAVQLSFAGNMLTVKATRPATEYPDSHRRHVCERAHTCYERAIPLPAAVESEGIRAESRDGLLTVTLSKSVASKGRSIPVARSTGGSKPADPI